MSSDPADRHAPESLSRRRFFKTAAFAIAATRQRTENANRERTPKNPQQQHGTRALDKALIDELRYDGSNGHLISPLLLILGMLFGLPLAWQTTSWNSVTPICS